MSHATCASHSFYLFIYLFNLVFGNVAVSVAVFVVNKSSVFNNVPESMEGIEFQCETGCLILYRFYPSEFIRVRQAGSHLQ